MFLFVKPLLSKFTNYSQLDMIRLIYTYVKSPSRGWNQCALRKELGMETQEYWDFISKAAGDGILRITNKNICPGEFPGGVDKNRYYLPYDYILDEKTFCNCVKAAAWDKTLVNDLSRTFLTLPYVHRQYGILCENPYEQNLDLIKPLSISEIAKVVGMSRRRVDAFINRLSDRRLRIRYLDTRIVRDYAVRGYADKIILDYWNTNFVRVEYNVCLGGKIKVGNGKEAVIITPNLFYTKETSSYVYAWEDPDFFLDKCVGKEANKIYAGVYDWS